MNRSRYGASPSVDSSAKQSFTSRSAVSPRSFRNTSDASPQQKSNGFVVGRTSRIDPQVYTDTQSRGLTSRLASYYEQERQNAKPIVNRLYSRAGDLPIVHFHKNELTNSPRNSTMNMSSVRIPAPDKSTYQSNMRSEILRTGSMVGLNHHAGPLLHNSTASDPNPDTSYEVMGPLDALKEISRKRIHCDENTTATNGTPTHSSAERVKKQKANVSLATAVASFQGQQHFVPVTKRQRDTTSPTYKQTSVETQKKRPCTKNNDVLSSLSSSTRYAAITTSLAAASPKPKLDSSRSIPPTQHAQPKPADSTDRPRETTPNDTIPARAELAHPSAPLESPAKPNTTKLTLFNKRYTTIAKPTLDLNNDDNDDDDDDDSAGISFVKPKASTSQKLGPTAKRPVESSKLALMLSCLSGDLDEDDQVDAVTAKRTESQDSVKPVEAKTSIENVKPSVGVVAPVLSGFKLPEATSTEKPSELPATKADEAPLSVTTSIATSLSLPSFGTTSTASSISKADTVSTSTVSTSTATTASAATLAIPATTTDTMVKPAETKTFSFGASAATVATPVASSTTASVAPTASFSFGASAAPAAAPSFSFGTSKPADVPKTSASTLPMFGTSVSDSKPTATTQPIMSFGSVATPATTTAAVSSLTTSTTKPALLSTPINTATSSTTTAPAAAPSFSFGSSTSAPKSGGFSFKPSEPAKQPAASAFTFGSTQPTTTQAAAPPVFGATTTNNAPSFGSTTTTTASAFGAPSTVPSFGASAITPSFGASPAAPSFGSTTSSATPVFGSSSTTAAPPAFGSSTTTTAAAAPAFGSSAVPSFGPSLATTAPPSFGSTFASATTTLAAPKPGGFSFGATSTTTAPTVFGSNAAAPPLFGAATATTPNAPPSFFGAAAPSATPSAFGSPASTPSFGSSTAPSFGAPAAKPVFGSTTAAPPAFGSTTTSFGAPSAFGASTATPSFGSNSTAAPAFGASTTNAPAFGSNNTSAFGSSATPAAAAAPAFGSAAPAFGSAFGASAAPSFGSTDNKAAAPSFGATTQPANNFFGSSTSANAAPKPFAFGASTANAAAAPTFGSPANATPAFGSSTMNAGPAQQSSAFAFGSSATPAQSAPSAFNFGATATPVANTPSSNGSFNFSATTGQPSAFGSNLSNQTSAAAKPFGMASATPAAAPFAFGSAAPVSAQPSTGSPFAFNSGSSTNTGSASSTGGAFNFSASTPQDGGVNLFSATAANGSAKGRPIRQATRRINK